MCVLQAQGEDQSFELEMCTKIVSIDGYGEELILFDKRVNIFFPIHTTFMLNLPIVTIFVLNLLKKGENILGLFGNVQF